MWFLGEEIERLVEIEVIIVIRKGGGNIRGRKGGLWLCW